MVGLNRCQFLKSIQLNSLHVIPPLKLLREEDVKKHQAERSQIKNNDIIAAIQIEGVGGSIPCIYRNVIRSQMEV